jgi:beta-lactamase class A
MKKIKRRGITASQKQYLARQLVALFLCDPSIFIDHLESQLPKKSSVLSEIKHEIDHTLDDARDEVKESTNIKKFVLAASILLAVVGVQLLYPHDRALPLARLQANGFIGLSTKDQIMSNYQDFDSRTVTIHTHGKTHTTSYSDLGVRLQPDATIKNVTAYSTAQRLIPFSIFVVGNKTFSLSRELDKSQIELFARDTIAQTNKSPKDAVVTLTGTTLSVLPSEEGHEYRASVLKSQILRSDLSDKAQIVFAPTILPPAITTDTATNNAKRMQQRISTPLLVQAEDKAMTITPDIMALWLDIIPKPDQNNVELSFNKAKVADTLRPLAGQVQVNVTPTVVTILNGMEAGRAFGTRGKVLQFEELINKVVQASSPTIETVIAPVQYIEPKEVIDRRYTKDSVGMQSLIDYWTATHGGEYSIDFRTVNGRIMANKNQYQITSAVGIYRLYIAHLIYGRITAKSLNGSSPTATGLSVDACMDKMIRESDDGCTNSLGDLVGWSASDDMLRAQGFDNTTLARNAALTTAANMSDWMIKLLGSNITTKAQSDSLTGLMSRQSVRSGMPAGSSGIRVADKTGSFGRSRHDVGIVYHPGGTYVLSVLSEGSSFALIADLTREINKVMSQ